MEHCPVCGAFMELAYRQQHGSCIMARYECNKCGSAFRGVEPTIYERFEAIRKGKTTSERDEIAYCT